MRERKDLLHLPAYLWRTTYRSLEPAVKAALWKDKLAQASDSLLLSDKQEDFLLELEPLLQPVAYENPTAHRELLESLRIEAMDLFQGEIYGKTFHSLGDLTPNSVIKMPPLPEPVDDCDCDQSSIFACDWLGGLQECMGTQCGEVKNDCGFLGMFDCDGLCQGPQPAGAGVFTISAGTFVIGTSGLNDALDSVGIGVRLFAEPPARIGRFSLALERSYGRPSAGPPALELDIEKVSLGYEYPVPLSPRFRPYLGGGFSYSQGSLVGGEVEPSQRDVSWLGGFVRFGMQGSLSPRTSFVLELEAADGQAIEITTESVETRSISVAAGVVWKLR